MHSSRAHHTSSITSPFLDVLPREVAAQIGEYTLPQLASQPWRTCDGLDIYSYLSYVFRGEEENKKKARTPFQNAGDLCHCYYANELPYAKLCQRGEQYGINPLTRVHILAARPVLSLRHYPPLSTS